MKIELKTHYSGIPAGGAKYAPGIYDTAKGDMPHRLALYLLNTEQAVVVKSEDFSEEIDALVGLAADQGVTDNNEDTPPDMPSKPAQRGKKGKTQ